MHFLALCGSNNTNKLSPQELSLLRSSSFKCSNNTNKLSPQELGRFSYRQTICSNNTNKLSPQEHPSLSLCKKHVQIIQINLVLKNSLINHLNISKFK